VDSLDHPGIQKVRTALRVEVAAIANSLVFRTVGPDGAEWPLRALTSGARPADTGRLAVLVGAERVGMADPDVVRMHTGQAIGGVAPLGHPTRIPTLVDATLAEHPVVWAAAGHPKAAFPTTLAELVELSAGEPAEVATHTADVIPPAETATHTADVIPPTETATHTADVIPPTETATHTGDVISPAEAVS
jgi:prolyl-tRNA editing enzyme YbaK/EbsC (Cys-tRNA(Pro) deacylase)